MAVYNRPSDNLSSWVMKKSKWIGRWRFRYATLRNGELAFADGLKDPHMRISMDPSWRLKEVTNVLSRNSFLRYQIEISTKWRCLCRFSFTSAPERDIWMRKIEKEIEKARFRDSGSFDDMRLSCRSSGLSERHFEVEECPVCWAADNPFLVLSCGHECCAVCWEDISLRFDNLCPLCREEPVFWRHRPSDGRASYSWQIQFH